MLSKFKAPEFHLLLPHLPPQHDSVIHTFGETARPLENEKGPESIQGNAPVSPRIMPVWQSRLLCDNGNEPQ